jgi:dTDP-3-amino-2,3,6-trideoxy-4-keto-D-glucose/dTDP-3-amino-3,4,6-trideoxy-alpha-D-glucose/dTDP-2,6-dideoxy-D-kanosamine transaminase
MSSMVPLNDLSRITKEDLSAISELSQQVIASGHYVSGPFLEHFEAALASYVGVSGAIGVGNGTDALILSMLASGIKPGDVVLTVANAGSYSTIAAKAIGAEPVFCDVNQENLQMSIETLEQSLRVCAENGISPSAVVITHLFGLLNPEIAELAALARSKGIVVIEDCAQAIGARSSLGKAGSFGDIAAFSFYPTKNLGALGDGGAVVSNNAILLGKTRALREYGWGKKYHIEMDGGRNSRLDELQAAILLYKLRAIDTQNQKRRAIYARYLSKRSNSFESFAPIAEDYVAHLAVFAAKSAPRDKVQAQFEQMQVSTGIHYPTLDVDQRLELKYRDLVPLPISRKYVESIFTVPLFPEMTEAEVETVATALSREV